MSHNGDMVFAQVTGHPSGVCGKSAIDTPCFAANQSRNAFRGPNFTNTDLNITKKFRIKERHSSWNRGADTRVCGVENRLDASAGLFRGWEFR